MPNCLLYVCMIKIVNIMSHFRNLRGWSPDGTVIAIGKELDLVGQQKYDEHYRNYTLVQ